MAKESEYDNQVTHALKKNRIHDKQTYVSCWRRGGKESSIFWDAYIGDKKGVAIQTTVGKLRKYIEGDIWNGYIDPLFDGDINATYNELSKFLIGNVEYISYEGEPISNSNLSPARFFHKRSGFADEQEFRIVRSPPPHIPLTDLPEPTDGFILSADLESLIDKVILPPFQPEPYEELVRFISDRDLDAPTVKSDLEKAPKQANF